MSAASSKALCCWAAGAHRELLALTRDSLESYADRHGYELIARTDEPVEGRAPSWSKVRLLHDALDDHELAVWIDADAVIVDHRIDIASELRVFRDLYVVAHRYDGNTLPNFGVVMLRSSSWSRRFLGAVWSRTEFLEHRWWENAAALELLGYDDHWPWRRRAAGIDLGYGDVPVRWRRPTFARLKTRLIDKAWNSVWADESPNPRIVHFPGKSVDERIEMMTTALANAKT